MSLPIVLSYNHLLLLMTSCRSSQKNEQCKKQPETVTLINSELELIAESGNENEWEYTCSKGQRKKDSVNKKVVKDAKVIRGWGMNCSLQSGSLSTGPLDFQEFYVGNLAPGTTNDSLISHLKELKIPVIRVSLFDPAWAEGRSKSAKVRVDALFSENMKTELNWPQNVFIREWYKESPKVNQQNKS